MINSVIVPGNLHKNFIKNLNFVKKIFVTKSVIIKPFFKKSLFKNEES